MKKFTVQNMREVLCHIPEHDLPEKDFLCVKNAYNTCLTLLWIEEKFNILSQNYDEWEEEIKSSYDFFLRNQNSDPDCSHRQNQFGLKEIIILNRRLNNFLSSVRLYQDQVSHNLSSLEEITSKTLLQNFQQKASALYDSSLSYQLMEFIRNYMQHQGLIVNKLTVIVPFSRKIDDCLPYFIEIDLNELRSVQKFNAKIKLKHELDGQCRWLNLIGIMREYYQHLSELHEELRDITSAISDDAEQEINKFVKDYYNDFTIPSFAFESNEPTESFLLQMPYLCLLKRRRAKSYMIKHAERKVFREKIKAQNAVRIEILYNQF